MWDKAASQCLLYCICAKTGTNIVEGPHDAINHGCQQL